MLALGVNIYLDNCSFLSSNVQIIAWPRKLVQRNINILKPQKLFQQNSRVSSFHAVVTLREFNFAGVFFFVCLYFLFLFRGNLGNLILRIRWW